MNLNPKGQFALVTALAICHALAPARAYAEEHVVPLSVSQQARDAAATRATIWPICNECFRFPSRRMRCEKPVSIPAR